MFSSRKIIYRLIENFKFQMQAEARRRVIGQYQIDYSKLLGKGATGHVYHGRDLKNQRHVACKVIDMSKVTNEVTRYLLENQKAALKMVHHPNIMRCYDIFQQSDFCYIITEFCNQGTLVDKIKQRGCINEDDALDLFDQIVDGYRCLVDKKIIHRDLKPANILMHEGVPKISDFGYCMVIGFPKPSLYYNVGSPCYMSPQALISSMYSQKSDIWALGVILYQLLVGQPFDKPNEHMVMTLKYIYENGLPYPPHVSAYCKKVIQNCLNFDLKKRVNTRKLQKILEDDSGAEDTTIIQQFHQSIKEEDAEAVSDFVKLVIKQFTPNNNGVIPLNNLPVALRAQFEKQMKFQQQVIGRQNIQQLKSPIQPQTTTFNQALLQQRQNTMIRPTRFHSLDIRMRPVNSAPIYRRGNEEQGSLPYGTNIPQQYPPAINFEVWQQPQMMTPDSMSNANQQVVYGRALIFRESADKQIPTLRYMRPMNPTSNRENNMMQQQVVERAMSAKSAGARGLISPYQQRNMMDNQGNKQVTKNYQSNPPQDIYGIGQSLKLQQAQIAQRQPFRPTSPMANFSNRLRPNSQYLSEYFPYQQQNPHQNQWQQAIYPY